MAEGHEVERIYATFGIKNEFSGTASKITSELNKVESQFKSASSNIGKSFKSPLSSATREFSSFGKSVSSTLSNSFSGIGKKITSSLSGVTSSVSKMSSGVKSALGSAFSSINTSSLSGLGSKITSSLSGVKNYLKSWGKDVKNDFTTAKNDINNSFNSINPSTLKTKLNSALSGVRESASKIGTTIKTTISNSLKSLSFSNIKDKIKSSLSSAKESVQSFATSAKNAFNGLVTAGQSVADKMGVIGVALTAVFTSKLKDAITSATSVFMNFDDQMRKVQAVTESTGAQFDALTSQAKLLGATTSYTAQDAAEAMTYLGQAGFTSTQIIAAMPATLNLARASMTELGTTADIMSNIMNGFQIGAEDTARASDVLSKAANATNTDVTGLGQAMKYAAPLAHQMSWSLEETAAAAGLLSNAGIKADMAGTVLRNAITRLIAPTDKTVEILQDYGITLDMVNPKTHSLAEILDTLSAAGVTSGNVMKIFGMRAGPGMMALVNQGTDALRAMNTTLEESGGYAQKAADEMDAGWGGVVRLLGDTVEALQLSFGNAIANMLTPFAEAISKIGYVISQLPSPIIYAASAVAMLAVAAGTLLVSLAALPTIVTILSAGMDILTLGLVKASLGYVTVAASLGTYTVASTLAAAATTALGTVVGILTSPITIVIAAIAALGVAFYEIEQRTHVLASTWETLQDIWTIGVYYIEQAFDSLKSTVSDAIDWVLDSLHKLANDTGLSTFVDTVTGVYDKIAGALGRTRDNIHETAESIRSEDAQQAESAANVQKQIETAHNGVINSYNTVDEETGQTYASMIENADSMSEGVTGANQEVIDSNNSVISSNNAVSQSSPTITYTLDKTDIDSISDPIKGKAFVTADNLNKGIELADGSMLKFNQTGELVIETLDGIQKRLYDIGNTNIETKEGGKIWTFSDNYTETNGKLMNNTPTHHVSMAEATAAAEEEEKYLNSPEATAAKWQEQHPNDTMVYVKKESGSGGRPAKLADKYSVQQVNDMLVDKNTQDVIESNIIRPGDATWQASIDRGTRLSDKNNPLVGQGKTPLSEEYLQKLKDQQALESPISSISRGGILDKIKAAFTIPKTDKPTEYDRVKKELASFDWSKLFSGPSSGSKMTSASFAPNIDAIIEKYNIVKDKMQEINSFKFDSIKSSISGISDTVNNISFDGLKTSIQGYVDKFSESASAIPGVQSTLDSLNGISYEGLKTSVQGYIDKFSESASQIPGVQSALDGLNGISYEGLKSSIQGYMTKFEDSVTQNPTVKSALESLNSISYEGLKSTIQGYMSKFEESVSQNPVVKSTLESLNSISYEGLKSTIQGYMSKFEESVAQNPIVKSTLESLNSISYEGLKSTIQGYMTKFADSAAQIPGVQSALDTLNNVSYETLKSTIQGVISKFWDTASTIPGVRSAIEGINNISFSGILSSIGTVKTALEGLVSAAKDMYEKVKDYVYNANKEKNSTSNNSSTTNKTTNNTTNNNTYNFKTYAQPSNVTQWINRATGN